ncbi:MAG: Bug family tripartite tricarboxylate transporter substrate binding protein [Acetobacteraceae bacterium]
MSHPRLGRRALLGAVASLGVAAPAIASPPRRNVVLMVGAPAGSAVDRVARSIVPFLARHWQRVALTVENLHGGGGVEAAREVAESPEGQPVLGFVTTPGLLARCIQSADQGLPDRLAWFGPITDEPLLLAARAGQGTVSLVSAATPGDRLIGCGPAGSASHLAALQIAEALDGVRALPFASAVAAARAAAAGHVAAAVLSAAELRRAARPDLLPAAIATSARLPDHAGVPTLTERGIPLVASVQRGLVARPGFPGAGRLSAAIRAVREDPEFQAWAEETGARPGTGDPADWLRTLGAERSALAARWSRSPWTAGG